MHFKRLTRLSLSYCLISAAIAPASGLDIRETALALRDSLSTNVKDNNTPKSDGEINQALISAGFSHNLIVAEDSTTTVVRNTKQLPQYQNSPGTMVMKEENPFSYSPETMDPDVEKDLGENALNLSSLTQTEGILKGRSQKEKVDNRVLNQALTDEHAVDTGLIRRIVESANNPPVLYQLTGLDTTGQQWREDFSHGFTIAVGDPDTGDSVRFSDSTLPGFISLVEEISGESEHQFRFRVNPQQNDIGIHFIKLEFADKKGAKLTISTDAIVSEINDMPIARIVSLATAGGAARVVLDVEDEDGTLAETQFSYKLVLSGVEKSRSSFTATASFDIYPLLNGDYQLEVSARDKYGFVQEGITTGGFSITGVDSISFAPGAWHLAGIPMSSLNISELGDSIHVLQLGNHDREGALPTPLPADGSIRTLEAGKGYWLKPEKPITLSLTEAQLNRDVVVTPLQAKNSGWNLVGNPFPYPIDMSGSGFIFWEWDPSSADVKDAGGLLQPWNAYWVQSQHDTTLKLPARPCFNRKPLVQYSEGYRGEQYWMGRLILRAGPYSDHSNLFGVRPLIKTASYANRPDPPKMGSHVKLFFPNRDGASQETRYTTDIRAAIDPDEEWYEFGIVSDKSGRQSARLSLEGMEKLRTIGYTTFLLDKNEARELKNGSTIELPLSEHPRYYFIVVTGNPNFKEKISGDFILARNSSSPVRHGATFEFHLPYRFNKDGKKMTEGYPVSIKCHNMKGHLLKTIFKKLLPEGSHTVHWRRSVSIPSGNYLFRLQAGPFQASKEILLGR